MDAENAKYIKKIGRHVINACVEWARIRGYSDSVGMLWGLIYLAKGPVSLDELVVDTGYSKSTVSSSMNLLENLRFVRRIVLAGDKKHRYMPIIDSEIIRINMLDLIDKEIQLFIAALDKSENEILTGGAESKYLLDRFSSLKRSCEEGKKTIDLLKKQVPQKGDKKSAFL